MDWTMIANADGPVMRFQTLYYLLKDRYQLSAAKAAELLQNESKDNRFCSSLLNEIKAEINQSTNNLGMGKAFTDSDVRSYFRELLSAFEE